MHCAFEDFCEVGGWCFASCGEEEPKRVFRNEMLQKCVEWRKCILEEEREDKAPASDCFKVAGNDESKALTCIILMIDHSFMT